MEELGRKNERQKQKRWKRIKSGRFSMGNGMNKRRRDTEVFRKRVKRE